MKRPLFPGIGSDTAFVTPGDSMAPNFDHRHITNKKFTTATGFLEISFL